MTQVNRDNVLHVRNVIKRQADQVQDALQNARWDARVGRCGGDPISEDASLAFNRKISELLAVHWAHHAELSEAVDRLTRTAHSYGYTEAQVTDSFTRFRAAL